MTAELRGSLEKAVAALKACGAREVYLFGSASSSAIGDASDIDMAVSGLPPENFFTAMGEASDILGRPLDLIDLDEPNPFTRYLKAEGELQRVG